MGRMSLRANQRASVPLEEKTKQNYFVTSFLITELKLTEVVLWLENIQ